MVCMFWTLTFRSIIILNVFFLCFSILGMHIFGCKFSLKTEAGDTVPDRKNFDSLLWAIVTVFQVWRVSSHAKPKVLKVGDECENVEWN